MDTIKSMYLATYLGIGAVNVATLATDFPDIAPNYTDVSNDDFTYGPFYFGLANSWRTVGLKATASQCESSWQNYRIQFVPGKLPAADYQKKLAKMDSVVQVSCMELELRATGPTASLRQKYAQLDKTTLKNWYLSAGLGDVQTAVDAYHKRYANFVDEYTQYLASLNTDLQKAKADNDQKQIAELSHDIDVLNFETKYHAQVDDEVETALKAGQPVTVLRVLN